MITKGSNYTCDRCGKVEFLTDAEARNTKWAVITHITADAVNVSRLLCETCCTEYKAVADAADKVSCSATGTTTRMEVAHPHP